MDWITHEEDVWFEFRGSKPGQLKPGRYYKGVVDGYADFGVFVDLASNVTGLLHRSELDRRLESLEWEPGDEVFVQVKNVRDNGNVDLGWSIRQSESEFRGARVHDPEGDADGEPIESESDEGPVRQKPQTANKRRVNGATDGDAASGDGDASGAERESEPDAESEPESGSEAEAERESESEPESESEAEAESEAESEAEPEAEPEAETPARVAIDDLRDRVGDDVRIEGVVVGVRQTGGPTIFEVRDETGVVDVAAFVEAGVRAYPDVDVDDVVRIVGEVELRRNELQVETETLVELTAEDATAVENRLDAAMTAKARPEETVTFVPHAPVDAVAEQLLDAAESIRRAVLESRPIVVRHAATADGYVAGAAIERAVLPLIREEYAKSDAEYHYFERRPLDDAVYGMDAATSDVTRMLQDRDRHDEKLPLVLLVGTGSTVESVDGLSLLDIYGTEKAVVDAAPADADVADVADVLVNPARTDADAIDLSTGALGATLAATVNPEVREDLRHLPAVSYWENAPEAYVELAAEAGYDETRVRELREAVSLEAYYQSYEDKRELITDLLFEDGETATPDTEAEPRELASHVAEQFRIKLDDELDVAEKNLDVREEGGVSVAVLDTDAFTHRFDFPPTALLVDELHRRVRDGAFVTVGVGMDELYIRSTDGVDVRAVAETVRDAVPDAGVTALGIREGRIEFLAGERDAVIDAVVDAAVAQFD